MIEPIAINSPRVHDTALSLIRGEDISDVLDLGAGFGALTKRLLNHGYNVSAADLHPENFLLKSVDCVKSDFNHKLKFANNSFDCVFCLDVIEHLENPYKILTECQRILRRDGILILSFPNIDNWYSRLYYLFTGRYPSFKEVYYNKDSSLNWDSHISPIMMHILEAKIAGKFRIEKTTTNRAFIPLLRIEINIDSRFAGENILMKLRKMVPLHIQVVDANCCESSGQGIHSSHIKD